jgi:hypothetical protein
MRATIGTSMSTKDFWMAVVLAEIELADAGQEFALPDWIGAEVTSDPRYRKVNMIADHVANQKFADTALLARADEVIE